MKSYLARGLTMQQIADEWLKDSGEEVTRQALSMVASRYDLEPANKRRRYKDLLPWRVREDHLNHYDARMLRLEGKRRAGGEMSVEETHRLESWKRSLSEQEAVVAYDADAFEGGFVWVGRGPGEELIHPPPAI